MTAAPTPDESPIPTSPEQAGSTEDRLYEQRVEKLNRLRQAGIDPYPARFARTDLAADTLASFESEPGKAMAQPSMALAMRILEIQVHEEDYVEAVVDASIAEHERAAMESVAGEPLLLRSHKDRRAR